MSLSDFARQQYNKMCKRLAKSYKVESVHAKFSVDPSVEQNLKDKIVEQSTFLPKINYITVTEMQGENILGSASQPLASRTDTSQKGKEREPQQILGMEPGRYQLHQTNFDAALRYNLVDAWAKFKDLPERYQRYIQERIANDKEIIGWNGVKAAKDTDFAANPLLQDVNKGWMQYMREARSENVLVDGAVAGELRIGQGGDYKSLDLLLLDMYHSVPSYMRQGLVALVGEDFIRHERTALMEVVSMTPTEKALYEMAMKLQGGLGWETPSNFPARGVVVTSYDNLSIYMQSGSWRRHLIDNPKKDQFEDYNSVNEGYVVEETEKFVGVEFGKVKLSDGKGGWL